MKTKTRLLDLKLFTMTALVAATLLALAAIAHADPSTAPTPEPVTPLPHAAEPAQPTAPSATSALPKMNLSLPDGSMPVGATGAATPAKPAHRLEWKWTTVSPAEYAIFGTLAAADTAMFFLPAPTKPLWVGTNPVDTAARGALRLHDQGARDAVNTASTGLVAGLALFPVLVDSIGITMIGDKNVKAGVQMLLIDAESFSAILAGLLPTKTFLPRARPYNLDCPNPNCSATDRYESFFSGHTSLAFNSAGLICTEHLKMNLWGSKAADVATCIMAVGTAAGVGVMRIMDDQHNLTDVLAGAALGSITGFLIPQIHFGHQVDTETGPKGGVSVSVAPFMTGQEQGVGISGVF